MQIRTYQPGDEEAQALIYNAAAGALPAFKPATADEVSRRYAKALRDGGAKFYAVDGATGEVVGYCLFNPNGRLSYPWCLPGSEAARGPLLDAVLDAMRGQDMAEAWAAYRADWTPVLDFLGAHGFAPVREVVNFLAETAALPAGPDPPGLALGPLGLEDLTDLLRLGGGLIAADDPDYLGAFFWENPFFGPESLIALRADGGRGAVVGAALAIAATGFADPSKLDAAMPCFRLGALGTERERHKRVNGMVSCVFTDGPVGEALLAEAARRFRAAGLAHAAAQATTDRPDLVAFYGRYFRRQGAFPVLSRRLGA
jgi:hypothetical protein